MNIRHHIAALLLVPFLGLGPLSAQAQTQSNGLPAVPTVKILAIGRITSAWTPTSRQAVMPQEVRETVRLYLDGKIDQWFVRKDQPGVVFVLNVANVEEAHTVLDGLPLGKAKLMEFELIPLGPLAPLTLLLNEPAR